MCGKNLKALLAIACLVLGSASSAVALPWDFDMYRQESLQSNEIARSPAQGTVPVGRVPFTMTIDEADKALANPVPKSFESAWRGQRLWNANCSSCHGLSGVGNGPVSKLLVGVPNLLGDLYKQRTDGRVFAVIYYGQNAMPRYGYKFSEAEKWDMVNYLRFLQGTDVAGLTRPSAE